MFAYCHNNPVLFIDASGYVIELASDATDKEIEEYERAIAYLKTSKTAKALIEMLEQAATVFTVAFVSEDYLVSYEYDTNTINFKYDSGLVLLLKLPSVQSAAMGLAHEMGHAAQDLMGLEFSNDPDDIKASEKHNLETYEIPIAKELGEPVRYRYDRFVWFRKMDNSTHFITQNQELFLGNNCFLLYKLIAVHHNRE